MGTWAENSFDNDQSFDWFVMSVSRRADGSKAIEHALLAVLDATYLETPVIEEAVAAAEVVACALGQRDADVSIPKEVDEWLQREQYKSSKSVRALAISSLDIVLTEDKNKSELADPKVWCIEDGREWWCSAVRSLQRRLIEACEQ